MRCFALKNEEEKQSEIKKKKQEEEAEKREARLDTIVAHHK